MSKSTSIRPPEIAPRTKSLRDARRAFTRDAICTAAREVFTEHGYGSATLEMIAKAAGTQRSTVYNHFRDKEAILAAIADDYFLHFLKIIEQLPGPKPSRLEIEEWAEKLVAFNREWKVPSALFMNLGDSIDKPETIEVLADREIEALARKLPAFARAVAPGPGRSLARARAASVLRQLGWACIHAMQPPRHFSPDDSLTVAVELFENFINRED